MSASLPPRGTPLDLNSDTSAQAPVPSDGAGCGGVHAQCGSPEGPGDVKGGVLGGVVEEKSRECDGEGVDGESSEVASENVKFEAGESSAGSSGGGIVAEESADDTGMVDSSSIERVTVTVASTDLVEELVISGAARCNDDNRPGPVLVSAGDPPLGGEDERTVPSGFPREQSEDMVVSREEFGIGLKPDLGPTGDDDFLPEAAEDVHRESSNLEEVFPSNEDAIDHSDFMDFPVDPLLGGEACIVEAFESSHRHGERLYAHRGKLRAGDTIESPGSRVLQDGGPSVSSLEAKAQDIEEVVHTSDQLQDGYGDVCNDVFETENVSSDPLCPKDERTSASKDESTVEHAHEVQEFSHLQDGGMDTCQDELEDENPSETEESPILQNENWDGYGHELKDETVMGTHESTLQDVNVNCWYEDDLRPESNTDPHEPMEIQYENRVFSRNASEAEYKMFIRDGNMNTWGENQNAVNLVVDLSPYHADEFNGVVEEEGYSDIENLELESCAFSDEKEDRARYLLPPEDPRFSISDLVWGKVRSHPWWPAQIFDPSDASETAIKYKKRDSYLVAYFGDHTFAWNDVSLLRPFRTYFTKMEKQSSLAAFVNAVDRALDEVFRRVEFGLACYCTPQDVYDKIKSQRIDNTGVRDGASVADTAYGAFNMTSLEPDNLVHYVKDLALFPLNGGDKLELTIAKAQILSFYRSKGFPKLPEFYVHRGLSENEANLLPPGKRLVDDNMVDDVEFETPSSKRPRSQEGSTYKRKKKNSDDGVGSIRKQRRISDVIDKKKSSPFVNDGRNRSTVSSTSGSGRTKKRKVSSLIDIDKNEPSTVVKKSFNVGECIRRIATQLTGSPHSPKSSDVKSQKHGSQVDQSKGERVAHDKTPEKHPSKNRTKMETSSPEEMLSQLRLAARDPRRGYNFVSAIIDFFSEYRNELCRCNDFSAKQKVKLNVCKSAGKKSADAGKDYDEAFEFEDVKDTYWEKRITRGNTEEPKRSELDSQIQLDDQKESEGIEIGKYSPTALILNFNEVKSLPSKVDLIKTFAKYGPLKESQTQVWTRTKRAKVVFYSRFHAEVAFSSAGKFHIFGPSLVSYRLRYLSSLAKSSQDHTPDDENIVTSIESSKPESLPVENGVALTEIPSPDDNRPGRKATCESISVSREESKSVSSSIDVTQRENGATVPSTMESRSKSLVTEKEESNVECGAEPLSANGSIPVSQLPETVVPPMESGAEPQSCEADDMTQLPGNGGSQLQFGVVPSSLGADDQESQVPENSRSIVNSGAEQLQTERGLTVASTEGSKSKSIPTDKEVSNIECGAEPLSADGSMLVSQLPEIIVAPLESGAEPQSSEADDMMRLPENGSSQLQSGVLASSLSANDQEFQVPDDSESLVNSGVEQLPTECGASVPSTEASKSQSLLTDKEESTIECGAEPPSTDGSMPVSLLAENIVAPMEPGAEPQSSETEDTAQLPENWVVPSSLGVNDQESRVPENSGRVENAGPEQLPTTASISRDKIAMTSDEVTDKLVEIPQKKSQTDSRFDQPEECELE